MPDPFKNLGLSLSSPAINAAEVTPDDAADLSVTARALWVGGAGDVVVITAGGDQVAFAGASGMLPVRVDRVLATGTTASQIVALW